MLFEQLNISEEIIESVKAMGFEQMTEIQEKSIPLILEGRDITGKSNTGTGKTAAFGIPAAEMVNNENKNTVSTLILCPTRELSMQVCDEIKKFSSCKRIVRPAAVYGGASIEAQIRELKHGANIVVGTPGRILDHIRRKTLRLESLKLIVLDEADEMLNMGFKEDIESVLLAVPENRQTALFSATMPPAIMSLASEYQNDPVMVSIESRQKTVSLIKQYYVMCAMGRKTDTLQVLLAAKEPRSAMIFCNTKKMADELTTELGKRGFLAAGLHGDLKQTQRTQVMQNFKNGTVSILVATDVAARGIDVDDVEYVFNYDLPQDFEYYIHRIGRTGRAGKEGTAVSLVSGRKQLILLGEISEYIKAEIKEIKLPKKEQIISERLERFKNNIIEKKNDEISEKYFETAERICKEGGISPMQLSAMLIQYAASPSAENIPDIEEPRPIRNRFSENYGQNTVRVKIDLGRRNDIAPNFILGALVETTGLKGRNFGKIDIFDDFTTVEVPEAETSHILKAMQGSKIKGNRINIVLDNYGRDKKSGKRKLADAQKYECQSKRSRYGRHEKSSRGRRLPKEDYRSSDYGRKRRKG